ncbi:hypothetical protein ACOQFO_11460 [Ureibacillus sp. MALMAid1270]|uniref:hypothetical protein n=1 Tax=Ureibacillus sp. MALMAid1270 TaxID=3411629 RepID=UPI003BA782BF
MEDFRTLKLLDRFERIFTRFGVDYKIMRKILQVKFTMDGRRVPTIFSQNSNQKEKSNQYVKSLWIYVLFGLFMIPFILMGENYLFQMSLFYGIFTFFVMTSMISDFSSVLLDVRDRNILFTKPVNNKTINTAKFMHIIIYISFLTIALVGIPLIVALINKGIGFFIITLINIILLDFFIVALTALIYLFILRFFDGEKLKDIINYVQIGLSLAILVGYQLLVRSFQFIGQSISIDPDWWQLFIFPIWFAANTEMLLKQNFEMIYTIFTILSIIVPIIVIRLYMKFNPAFEHYLQKLSFHGKAKEKKQNKIGEGLLKIICPSQQERSFFRFASRMMKNEREFKLKVYPSLGFSIVIPFIFILNELQFSSVEGLTTSNSYFSIYFCLIIIPSILVLLKYSGKYKGAWVYSVAPLKQLKPMYSGTIKAFILKLFLPVYVILSIAFIVLFGVRIVPDLIIVFLSACIFAIICFMILKKFIPFAESFDDYNQNSTGMVALGLSLIIIVFAGLHYFSTFYNFGIYIYLAALIIALIILFKTAFNINWDKIYS